MRMSGSSQNVWLGKAFCELSPTREEYKLGHRGAVFVFVCLAADLKQCVSQIVDESAENGLMLAGFEYLMRRDMMDREPSEYEEELIRRLKSYKTQFENVHFFNPDA